MGQEYIQMIIWINGAFGSGKTTCAWELKNRLKNSFVFDPEQVGTLLNIQLPNNLRKRNFQDYPLWRIYNFKLLEHLSLHSNDTIIVPMTIINEDYFEEIIEKLRSRGITVHHCTLIADKNNLTRRLHNRLEFGNTWAKQNIENCIQAFNSKKFGIKINTNGKSIDNIVSEIGKQFNLNILPDKRSKYKKMFDQHTLSFRKP